MEVAYFYLYNRIGFSSGVSLRNWIFNVAKLLQLSGKNVALCGIIFEGG